MATDVLTRVEALARTKIVGDVAYRLDLSFVDAAEGHRGSTTITCTLATHDPADMWLDFAGPAVDEVRVDGRRVGFEWDGVRLRVPPLPAGRRTIEVRHAIAARRSGAGLITVVDPADGRRYVGTMFEPFGAHRVYPCFDQPDLKGRFDVAVRAPADWRVIGNAPVAARNPASDGGVRTVLASIGPISPYVSAIMAGPFHEVRRSVGDLPVGYLARSSRARALDEEVDAIHAIVARGLGELEGFLDCPMPFPKLDHIVMPGFRDGAMENAGAITLEESFLFGPGASASQIAGRAEIVTHELAHMWLGDLVTMGWWDDLWLKESLATYVSFVILDSAGILPEAWVRFEAGRKAEALEDDRRRSAHPIVTDVPDTDAALVAGDDIAYGKGAAVLHQLVASIGPDAFRRGLQTLIRERAWGTAGLADLLAAMGTAADVDLHPWARAWLESSSVDTLTAETIRPDRRASVRVTRSGDGPDRTHHVAVTVAWDDGQHILIEPHPTAVRDAVIVPVPSSVASVLVLPDGSGRAYARVALDPPSLVAARALVARLDDPVTRQVTWNALWEAVHRGELPAPSFVEEAIQAARFERSPTIAASLLVRARHALRWYVPIRSAGLGDLAVDLGLEAARDPDAVLGRAWLRLAVDAARSPGSLRRVGDAILDEPAVRRVVTTAMRWDVTIAAAARGMSEARVWAEAARAADPDGAAAAAAAIEAARADPTTKARAWARIIERRYEDEEAAEAAMGAFFRPEQLTLVQPYVAHYVRIVEEVAPEWPVDDALAFVSAAFPALPEVPGLVGLAEATLQRVASRAPALARPLTDAIDDLTTAVRLRAVAGG